MSERMEIIGYSERELLNSLFYEIKYPNERLKLINKLVSLINFPFHNVAFLIKDVTIFIEQSFSDFGNADCVLFVDSGGHKQSIFIEAKVKTFQRKSWLIEEEFTRLERGIEKNKVSSSNLFTQLYYKYRLFNTLRKDDMQTLEKGIEFPQYSSKRYRSIGSNQVVRRAVDKLRQYNSDAFFIALVPDDSSNIKKFYEKRFLDNIPFGLKQTDIRNWGFITWANVEGFCKEYGLKLTQEVFNFNKRQIY